MSLFKRPAWAKTQTSDADAPGEDTNIFNHSDRSYRGIIAEQERKKKEKVERKKAKGERRNSGKREVEHERSPNGSAKRRRITLEDGEALLSSVGLSSKAATEGRDAYEPVIVDDETLVRRSPRTNRHVDANSPRKPLGRRQIVDLGDDDGDKMKHDEEHVYEQSRHERPRHEEPRRETVEVADDSEDEFAELARKARQARQQKDLNGKKSRTPDVGGRTPSPGVGASDLGGRSLPTPPPDPAVEIFVTSRIPGANPLIVHRKLSQRVQEIRIVWCKKQGFSEEMTGDVFFIHRMRKIYDATTCRSLGLDVDAFGNIVMKGAEGKEGVEKVHLEAVTEEIFQDMKAEKAREEKRRSGELPPEEDLEAQTAEEEAAAQEKPKEAKVHLVLKARGRKDFKLVVKPTTQFSKIVGAYRKMHGLDDSATVSLEFDGDRLNPDDEVQSTEITDMDCLDVHIN